MRSLIAVFALTLALPAAAQSGERDYCPERPGLGDEPCTIAPGRVSVETGAVQWTRDSDPESRTDSFTLGQTLVRVGVAEHGELSIGWTPFAVERVRDRASGAVETHRGTGDLTLSGKRNLVSPDGEGFSIALEPYVTLPIGTGPEGAGDWGAGLTVPLSHPLWDKFSLGFTGTLAAAPDDDGNGRHFQGVATAGLEWDLTEQLSTETELQFVHDEDLGEGSNQGYAGLSIAWKATDDWQFDIGGAVGLNRAASDAQAYLGLSRRF